MWTVRYFIFFKSFKEAIAAEHVFGISLSFKSKNIICFLSNFDKKDLNGFIKNGYFYKDNKYVDLFIRPKSSSSKYDYLQITINLLD